MISNRSNDESQGAHRLNVEKRSEDRSSKTRMGQPTSQSNSVLETRTLADLPVLISPDGVSQFRVVKQLVTSESAVIRPERGSRAAVAR
jgi:hypothetical protein